MARYDDARRSKWERAFKQYDRENPRMYRLFERFVFELIDAGRKRISHGTIIERLRWESYVSKRDRDFKINQNFGRPMAVRFVERNPEYEGIFEFRRQPRGR